MVRHNGYEPKFGNLIPEFERVVDATQPLCFLMEEVPKAPVPNIASYGVHEFILNNRQLGEDQNRVRRISFGWRGGRKVLMVDVVALESRNFEYAACGGTHGEGGISREQREDTPAAARARARKRGVPVAVGGSGKLKPAARRITLNDCVGNNVKPRRPTLGSASCKDCRPTSCVGNGVPLPMGRAIARAVKEAMQFVP
jgi:hypothetical protein